MCIVRIIAFFFFFTTTCLTYLLLHNKLFQDAVVKKKISYLLVFLQFEESSMGAVQLSTCYQMSGVQLGFLLCRKPITETPSIARKERLWYG